VDATWLTKTARVRSVVAAKSASTSVLGPSSGSGTGRQSSLFALAIATTSAPVLAETTKTEAVIVTAHQGQLSARTRSGDVIYTSGQLGVSRDTADNTIQAQTKRSLEAVQKVVEAAGSSMANVLKCTVFLTDVKDFQGMNSAYTQFFPKEPPGRSTVVVAALVSAAAKVEIECIAAAR